MAVPGLDDAARSIARLAENRAEDADETRRLLYMAILAGRTEHYELAGTLVNALRHHQGVDDPELEDQVLRLVETIGGPDDWAREQIARLTED